LNEVFLGENYRKIQQGKEFLGRNPGATGFEEQIGESLKRAEAAYVASASIAALEHHPGFAMVLAHLEEKANSLRAQAEATSADPNGKPHLTDKYIFAASQLAAFYEWLVAVPAQHHENIRRMEQLVNQEAQQKEETQ